MKVTENSAALLVLDDRPWILGLVLTTMVLAMVWAGIQSLAGGSLGGLGILAVAAATFAASALFIRRTQIVFDGPGGWVEVRSRTLFRYGCVRHRIDEIERAMVESMSSDNSRTYRVTLVIAHGQSAGRHPVTPVYSSGPGSAAAVSAINRWLDLHRGAA